MQPSIPNELGRLIKRCLTKPLKKRLQSTLDLRNELDELKVTVAPLPATGAPPVWLWVVAGIGLVSLAASLFSGGFNRSNSSAAPRLVNPTQVTSAVGMEDHPAWSPDGSQISFWPDRNGGGIYAMPALAGAARRVTSPAIFNQNRPQWSADGEELAYATYTSTPCAGVSDHFAGRRMGFCPDLPDAGGSCVASWPQAAFCSAPRGCLMAQK